MTPCQEFRLWTRRAPAGERVTAAAAIVVALALFVWLAVPSSEDGAASLDASGVATVPGEPGVTASTVEAGAAIDTSAVAPANATPTGPATTPRAGAAAPSPDAAPAASAGAGGCVSPPGTDQGVSDNSIKIAVTLVNLAGAAANNTFGLPSAEEQQEDYQQVADAINDDGGVACRTLVLQFFRGNPLDQSDLQQKCLDVTQAGVFAVIDAGAYFTNPAVATCFPTNRIPFFSSGPQPNAAMQRFYPYLFARASTDSIYHNAVFALRDRGFFDPAKGFKKLGFIHRDCMQAIVSSYEGWLRQAGVPAAAIVDYNVGCPSGSGFTSPSTLAQAVLKFQQNGSSHVTFADFGMDFATFTTIAQQQRFNPKYGFGDEAIVSTSYSASHPDYDNIVDAVAITPDQYGQERTPGLAPSPATAKCNAIYAAHGRGADVAHTSVGFPGAVCNELWIVAAAIGGAPALQRTALAPGLQAAKSVELSYPTGPNTFAGPRITHGDHFWRPVQFLAECTCWRVVDAAFHPSF